MAVSVFDLFKIGIGPSSSHTVGPMRAAARFVEKWLVEGGNLSRTARVICGLEGEWPDKIDPDSIPQRLERIRKNKRLRLHGVHEIAFDEKTDLIFNKRQKLPYHVNGMRFTAYDAQGEVLATRDYYSVGGGFVVNQDEASQDRIVADTTPLPHPFSTGEQLLAICERENKTIAQIMFENERAWRGDADIRAGLLSLWNAMQQCVARGLRSSGELPGGLHVKRRAPAMVEDLRDRPEAALKDPLTILDWVNLYALAVNEEN